MRESLKNWLIDFLRSLADCDMDNIEERGEVRLDSEKLIKAIEEDQIATMALIRRLDVTNHLRDYMSDHEGENGSYHIIEALRHVEGEDSPTLRKGKCPSVCFGPCAYKCELEAGHFGNQHVHGSFVWSEDLK